MLLCEMGLHRWSFRSRQIDETGSGTHTEVILGRCRREGCRRYGEWMQVHAEAYPVARALGPSARRVDDRQLTALKLVFADRR